MLKQIRQLFQRRTMNKPVETELSSQVAVLSTQVSALRLEWQEAQARLFRHVQRVNRLLKLDLASQEEAATSSPAELEPSGEESAESGEGSGKLQLHPSAPRPSGLPPPLFSQVSVRSSVAASARRQSLARRQR